MNNPSAENECTCPPGSFGRVMGMHKHSCPARSVENDAPRHDPTILTSVRHGCWATCTCGWESRLWTTGIGAHGEFGAHLASVTPPARAD